MYGKPEMSAAHNFYARRLGGKEANLVRVVKFVIHESRDDTCFTWQCHSNLDLLLTKCD